MLVEPDLGPGRWPPPPVPRPRPTRSGRRWGWLGGLRVAIFELVDGDPLHDRALADPADLDPDLVAFVVLRRNLDDLTDWLGVVLDGDRPQAQRRADLDGVRWCLSRRPELAARIDHTRRLLAGRRRTS
jgi:hypothetical protein